MRRYLLCLCILSVACSPYKKVTLTQSDRLSARWQNATETAVVGAMGEHKKVQMSNGYLLKFDYSYARVQPAKHKSSVQVRAAFSTQVNAISPRPNDAGLTAPRSAEDSVIKYIQFYFDKSEHVKSVYAVGYPDSVYYVKRRP